MYYSNIIEILIISKEFSMYRHAIEQLKQWKDSKNRKPLIIEGARQVGKTWLMQ